MENRPGAGSNIAVETAARSALDGATWLLGNNGILATNQALHAKLPFDALRDFATAASLIPHLRAGRLRALGVTSAQRSPSASELPAVAESGADGFEAFSWQGLVVPAATSAAVIAKFNSDFNAALATPDLKERIVAQGVEARSGKPEEFAALLRAEISKCSKVVRDWCKNGVISTVKQS